MSGWIWESLKSFSTPSVPAFCFHARQSWEPTLVAKGIKVFSLRCVVMSRLTMSHRVDLHTKKLLAWLATTVLLLTSWSEVDLEEQPGLLSPAGASSIVGLLLVVAVGVSLDRGLTLFNHLSIFVQQPEWDPASLRISEWNSDEGANCCAYVLTNLPVAIFGSVLFRWTLQCMGDSIS